MFARRRILDESWKVGKRVYILTLDIEKSFDRANLKALRDILLTRTNKVLINRIIKASMNETTCIE